MSENLKKIFFEDFEKPIFIVNPADGNIIEANKKTAELTGMPLEKLIGSDFKNILSEAFINDEGFTLTPSGSRNILSIVFKNLSSAYKNKHLIGEFRQFEYDGSRYTKIIIEVLGDKTSPKGKDKPFIELFSTLPLIHWMADSESIVHLMKGPGLENISVYSDDAEGKPLKEVFKDTPQIINDFEAALTGKYYKSILKINGRPFEAEYRPLIDVNGKVKYVFGTMMDISGTASSDHNLVQSRSSIFNIGRNIITHTVIVDKYGIIEYADNSWEEFSEDLFGRSVYTNIGSNFLDSCQTLFDGGNQRIESFCRNFNKLVSGNVKSFETEYPGHYFGEGKWIIASGRKRNTAENSYLLTFSSITDLDVLLREFSRLEQGYIKLLDNYTNIIYRLSVDGTITSINQAFEDAIDWEKEEITGKPFTEFIHPADVAVAYARFKGMLQGETPAPYDMRVVKKNGTYLTFQFFSQPVIENGRVTGIIGVAHDVTRLKEAEINLKRSEERFKAIIENGFEIVMLYSTSGRLTYVSPQAEPILGYKPEEILLQELKNNLIHPEDEEELFRVFSEVIGVDGSSSRFTARFCHKNGLWKTLSGVAVNRIADKNVRAIILICQDVTAEYEAEKIKKELEDELVKLSLIAQQTKSPIVLTNFNHEISWANEAFSELTGYPHDEALGVNFSDLFKSSSNPEYSFTALQEKAEKLDSFQHRIHSTTKNGKDLWCDVFVDPLLDKQKQQIGFIYVFNDLTENVHNERKLKDAIQKSNEMSKLKTNFLANMSHELRTPMIGIIGFAEIMRDELKDSEYKEMAAGIFNSGRRLIELINMLFSLSNIETDKLNVSLQNVDVVDLVAEVIKDYIDTAEAKGLLLEFKARQSDITAKLDPQLFKDIVLNLVNNSIKFTDEGSVKVSLENVVEESEKSFKLVVEDTGIGIPEDSLDIIFEEFRQVSEGLNRKYEGAGLGLTVTKKFVDAMGGKISVKSTVGKGTQFTVILPVEHRKTVQTAKDKPEQKEDRKPDLLLVEDDQPSINVTTMFLKKMCNIDHTDSGKEAIEMAAKKQYDVILMDINLGAGLNGIETTHEIRKLKGYEDTPIVALTAYAMKSDKDNFIEKGMSHYLSKPYDRSTLVGFVSDLIKNIEK